MNSSMSNFNYSWKVIFGIIFISLLYFIYEKNIYLLVKGFDLTNNKITPYSSSIDHPQYDLIIDLQSAFILNAKNVSPTVVNISKVKEIFSKILDVKLILLFLSLYTGLVNLPASLQIIISLFLKSNTILV